VYDGGTADHDHRQAGRKQKDDPNEHERDDRQNFDFARHCQQRHLEFGDDVGGILTVDQLLEDQRIHIPPPQRVLEVGP